MPIQSFNMFEINHGRKLISFDRTGKVPESMLSTGWVEQCEIKI